MKRGDVIGMYMPETFLIPYDVDQESDRPPMFMIPVIRPEMGETLKMNTWQAQAGMGGRRQYSLNCTVLPGVCVCCVCVVCVHVFHTSMPCKELQI